MILHTINKSYLSDSCLSDCLAMCTQQASVLFIEDGVYAATNAATEMLKPYSHIQFYALQADINARGLNDKLNPAITIIDDHGFVKLCVTHATVQAWY